MAQAIHIRGAAAEELDEVENLVKHFGPVQAVNGVSFSVARGETLGVVGESGCGKSTTGRAILQLIRPTSGEVLFDGTDLTKLSDVQLCNIRSDFQMIFQDPYGSLNPRSTVGRSVAQPMVLAGWKTQATAERVETLLRWVGLPSDAKQRYPHEFSGGQRQRIAIARTLPPTWKTRLRHLPVALRAGAILLAVTALARPRIGVEEIREVREGIAIQMVLEGDNQS